MQTEYTQMLEGQIWQGKLFQATVQKSKYGIADNTKTVNLLIVSLHNTGDSSCLNCLQVESLMLL